MAQNPEEQKKGSLAAWLHIFRVLSGYSQKNVADFLNVNRSTYTYYELGKTMPDPVTLDRIARIFGVPLEAFFSEESPEAVLGDPGVKPKRSPKKVKLTPAKIGDLTSGEKSIVAYLRDKQLPADKVLEALKKRFDEIDTFQDIKR